MATEFTLLYTDVVDSTAVNTRLGDVAMAEVWALHDRGSRDLLAQWRGREVDRSDGFMALFQSAADAADFAAAYHRLLAALPVPLQARAGLHSGPLQLRENAAADMLLGAKAVEVVGIAKAVSARLMAMARGGQTLASPSTMAALQGSHWQHCSHGHWRLKGWDEPIEVFEIGHDGRAFMAPADSDKARRVVLVAGQWTSAEQVPHNLPAEHDGFVGRADELLALSQSFAGGGRLVTLHGSGGIGKTRLALRHAWAWRGNYAGGLWFCDLAHARGLDGLLQATAHGLEVPLGSDPVAQLGRAIAGRGRCLVILDNFEQVARHADDTLRRWLAAAPQACFLVTSREVLGLPGECTLGLVPLSPRDAAALFHQRALAADAGHDAGATDATVIDALTDLLDHLPLAIELAAARVRTMTPHDLLARMGNRFQLLASRGGRPDRQATLRATLQWSWELLTGAERSALAQLSVFDGGCGWAAMEAVLDLAGCAPTPWLADLLQSLVDKSLLRPLPHRRFGLLRSVQDFAAEQLVTPGRFAGSGPALAAQAQRRHRSHFAGLDEDAAVAHGCVELDNLVRACRSAVAAGHADDATACLALAWTALRKTGPFRTAVALADDMRSMPSLTALHRAQIDGIAGMARYAMGAFADAHALVTQALAVLPAGASPVHAARLHAALGAVQAALGHTEQAAATLAQARTLALQSDPATLCHALNELGALAARQGQVEQARAHYEAALVQTAAPGAGRWRSGLVGNLAMLHYSRGDLHAALASYKTAVELARADGDQRREGNARSNLGLIHHELGNQEDARQELAQALQLARSMGHRQLEYTVLCNLGLVLEALGLEQQAHDHHAAAVAGARKLGDAAAEAQFRCCWALALARGGRHAHASDCLALAAGLFDPGADALQFGVVMCYLAQAEHLAANASAADDALRRAQAALQAAGVPPGSELERRIVEVSLILRR